MRLQSVYSRFYRSLNFDYIRASNEAYEPDPWDTTPSGTYPFVRLRLRPGITTVVGANESGKSQVLRAVEAALTGQNINRSDFCRYSRFFGVDKVMQLPEFGAVFDAISAEDALAIEAATGLTEVAGAAKLAVFRMNQTPKLRAYVQREGTWSEPSHVGKPNALLTAGVPAPFRIDADVPLPDSVPIQYLADAPTVPRKSDRRVSRAILEAFRANASWFRSETAITQNAANIADAVSKQDANESAEDLQQYDLAAQLLLTVAGLDRGLFKELQEAVKTKNGYANSIVDTINAELSKALDFPHWWSQDSQFELFVSLYEFDLIFMIRDRTGRSYGFDERSDGMKYFLSYFVQYLAHQPRQDGRAEILLMDEPDKFLSSSGQQDLLRVFNDFADPRDPNRAPLQVVYVTHSPYLIDKNEADRIRVLDKGEHDEGTRVVTSVAANHYEPLRSAFGGFVAETTFIGNCNLVVEGTSDQVLIAGTSRWLTHLGSSARTVLDLNQITIVPAGGTRHIPYLVYLARGRDVEKPPVVVLLDNDRDGTAAISDIAAGGAYGKTLLDPDLVLQLGQGDLSDLATDNPLGISGIEDLIPFGLAVSAAATYCREFVPGVKPGELGLTASTVFPADGTQDSRNRGLLAYLERAIAQSASAPNFHLDKVAFARATIDLLMAEPSKIDPDEIEVARRNFAALLSGIARRQRSAERAESTRRISSRINRAKRDFVRTHDGRARREDVLSLIEEIDSQLDNSFEADQVRITMQNWHRVFHLDAEPKAFVESYSTLLRSVDDLAYSAVRAAESA